MRARLLLTAGIVLMLVGAVAVGFVVKVVWVSGIDTGAAQQQLDADFEEHQTTSTTSAAADDPTISTVAEDAPTVSTMLATSSTTVPPSPPVTEIPSLTPEAPPPTGEVLGRILIPAADVDWWVVEGVGLGDLAEGPGHMPGTALPGQPGNAVISGHRTTHGAPFFHLDRLEPDDTITIETLIGTHVYQVVELRIVAPDDVYVTGDVEGAWLTLTTCNPPYRSIERLVVFARLTGGPNAAAITAAQTGVGAPPQPPGG